MNCLEFRRLLGSEPRSRNAIFLLHLKDCASCAEAHARALTREQEIERALEIDPPQGFNERILLRQLTLERTQNFQQRRRTWMQVAAALLLVVGAVAYWRSEYNAPGYEQTMVAHLAHEGFATSLMTSVPREQIDAAFRRAGLSVVGDLGNITYVALCREGQHSFVHLVEQAPNATYTVMVEPKLKINPKQIKHQGVFAKSSQAPGAVLTFLSDNESNFSAIENRWQRALARSSEAIGDD